MGCEGVAKMFAWVRRVFGARSPVATLQPREAIEEGTTPEEVYLEAARHFLDLQVATHDVLDTKALQGFSVGSVVLPLTFALLNLSNVEVPVTARWALGVALASYIALLVYTARASLVRGLEFRPNIATLRQHTGTYSGPVLKRWVADEHEASIQKNARILGRKARWVGVATLALYVEAVCLAVAAIATLLL